jgi:hypothetical protein
MVTGHTVGKDLKGQDTPSSINVRGSGIAAVCIIIVTAAIAYAIKTY